ncbi:2Fe-2S iron-sulfur cluster-binding protein [Alphaproteobacteria bacterium LSUCC0684]
MPSITFVKRDGSEETIEAAAGLSVMEIGRDNGIGIEGTCGGSLSCATCHVVVDAAWVEATGKPSLDEEDMLDLAFGLEETSRLGCQITLTEELDGLKVRLPDDD